MKNEITTYNESNNKLDIYERDNNAVLCALKNSVYPGASHESIEMVLNYCKAANLDPLQKPVHIVPMSVKDTESGQYRFRDIIMPGIGLYRIQSHRTGQYGGITEPEYGPNLILKVGNEEFIYPEWCKITVKKIVDGVTIEFTAKEFWIENYATAKKDTLSPNAMWKKRPFGQLAKCTEAQALRKAFPDIISHQPTFEELKPEIDNNCKPIEVKPKEKLSSDSERWAAAVQAVIDGKITIEKIINNFDISESDIELLKSDVLDGEK